MATTALSADGFVDSVGINVHSPYGTFDATNAYAGNWVPLVTQLGVRHVRDNFSAGTQAATAAAAAQLQAAGIGVLRIAEGTTQLTALLSSGLPAPEAIEGYNEYDSSGGSWASQLQTFQPTLYSQATAQWPSVKILGPSLIDNTLGPTVGDLRPNIDVVNLHTYAGPVQQPEFNAPYIDNIANSTNTNATGPGLPHWITETGWASGSDTSAQCSELAISRIAPRTLLRAYGQGVARTYIYELLDEHDPVSATPAYEDRFGFFRHDLSAKTCATTLGNMLRLLSDPGGAFTPGSLNFNLSTDTASVGSLLMQKRNGDFWLAFWLAANVTTNPGGGGTPQVGGTDLADTSHPFAISFDRTFRTAQLFRPLLGMAPIQSRNSVHSFTVPSYRDVCLLRLSGAVKHGSRSGGFRSYFDSRSTSRG